MFDRQKIGVLVAEFFGTAILAMTMLGATKYFNFTAPWYVGLAAGVSMVVLVGTIGIVSGAHVNPAITIGLWTLRKISPFRSISYIVVQLLGGLMALEFFKYVTGSDVISKLPSGLDGRVFIAEMVGTAVFGFGIAAVVMQKIEGMQAAFTIGASLFIGILIASVAGPGFLNPAVALANNTWNITALFAPIIGSILGMNLYSLFLAPLSSLNDPATTKPKR